MYTRPGIWYEWDGEVEIEESDCHRRVDDENQDRKEVEFQKLSSIEAGTTA